MDNDVLLSVARSEGEGVQKQNARHSEAQCPTERSVFPPNPPPFRIEQVVTQVKAVQPIF